MRETERETVARAGVSLSCCHRARSGAAATGRGAHRQLEAKVARWLSSRPGWRRRALEVVLPPQAGAATYWSQISRRRSRRQLLAAPPP